MFRIAKIIIIGLFLSTPALADDWGWHGHHGHHHGHRHWHEFGGYPAYVPPVVYAPQPIVEYVPVQPRYYAPPPPPPVGYYGYGPSAQGLVGGMVGSAMGYQLGRGDPLAAGLGAAAGAFFGNSMY